MWQITTTFRNLSVVRFCENNGVDLNGFFFFPFSQNVHGQRNIGKKSEKAKSASRVSCKEICVCLLTPGLREGAEAPALLVWLLLPSAWPSS